MGRPCGADRPLRSSARAAARTRAQSLRPPARRGSAGGRKAAVTYFLRLRSGQSGRLDRHSVPSQPRARQGGRTPGTGEGSWGCAGGTSRPGASNSEPPPPCLQRRAPRTPAGPCAAHELVRPRVPHELLPLLNHLPAALLLFLDDHLGVGAGGYGEAEVPCTEAFPLHRNASGAKAAGTKETPFRYAAAANSQVHGHALRLASSAAWDAPILGPPITMKRGLSEQGRIKRGRGANAVSLALNRLETKQKEMQK